MRAVLPLAALLALAGCATPREACERNALYDLRVLDALIRDTEQTIARGYGYAREPYARPQLDFCYGTRLGGDDVVGFTFCDRPDIGWRERPVAVDLAAERRNLADLKAKRQEAARRATRDMAACRTRYPEG